MLKVEEGAQIARLTVTARNWFLATAALLLGSPIILGCAVFFFMAIARSDYQLAFSMLLASGAIGWGIHFLGFRKRDFVLEFTRSGVSVSGRRYAYHEIADYGVDRDQGGESITADGALSPPATLGWRIYLEVGGRRRPATVGMSLDEANSALAEFDRLFRRFAT